MHAFRTRNIDINMIENSNKIIKIKMFDTELWHAHSTKAVDSEHEKKRHIENDQMQGVETEA